MSQKCFYTIDFEDWSFNFKREHNITTDNSLREDVLLKSYEVINNFCVSSLQNTKITFFITGVIAEKFPEIVRKISRDGHEVACHYYYHNKIFYDNPEVFEKNLVSAINFLENASEEKVLGFRAPFFAIHSSQHNYFKIIEKHFIYDSTFYAGSKKEVDLFKEKADLKELKLYPVTNAKLSPYLPTVKTGGTFFKTLPLFITKLAINSGIENGLVPIIYLHPYEILADQSFAVKMSEMKNIGYAKRVLYKLKQTQWNLIGNHTVLKKLRKLSEIYSPAGTIKSSLN